MEFGDNFDLWQRRIADGPDGARRRLATFDELEPRSGQAIVEIRCGGGHLVRDIALAVGPEGRADRLDIDADQLAVAERDHGELPAAEGPAGRPR